MQTELDSEKVLLVTHDGAFQADDILAYVMLRYVYPNSSLVRTRRLEQFLSQENKESQESNRRCILFDVGGKLDSRNNIFDHHYQSTKKPHYVFINGQTALSPMSSVGLVFSHFKKEILAAVLKDAESRFGPKQFAEKIDSIDDYEKWSNELCDDVYIRFIHEVDAIDEGVFNYGSLQMSLADLDEANENVVANGPSYKMFAHFSSLVSLYNNLTTMCDNVDSRRPQDIIFEHVANATRDIFCLQVASLAARNLNQKQQIEFLFTASSPSSSQSTSTFDVCVYKHPSAKYNFKTRRYRYHIYLDEEKKACVRTYFGALPDPDAQEGTWIHHHKFLAKFSTPASFETYIAQLFDGKVLEGDVTTVSDLSALVFRFDFL